jgi:F420-dependent oxidoreductase-like protein
MDRCSVGGFRMSKAMKLGLQLGYWGAAPPTDFVEIAQEAEKLGYDIVFTAESWGSDAFTPLAWIGAHTKTIRLGTAVVQISARTPTATAMHTLTLDHLTKGRFTLGLGVSGPQVVEGWYGQPFDKPVARTREYLSIVRQVLRREGPVSSPGPHYPLPYTGPGAWGMGKPLRSITHPAGCRSTTRRSDPRCTRSPCARRSPASRSAPACRSRSATTSPPGSCP